MPSLGICNGVVGMVGVHATIALAPGCSRWRRSRESATPHIALRTVALSASPYGLATCDEQRTGIIFPKLAFEKVLTYANHVGLYAGQISRAGQQQGNFPQALTHLALISAAFNLDRAPGA